VAGNFSQAFGYDTYLVPIISSAVDLTELALDPLSGFMDISTLLSDTASVFAAGQGVNYRMGVGTPTSQTVTNAVRTSNVVTLTFSANTAAVGDVVEVSGLGATFKSLEGVHIVTAQTGTTLSYVLEGANITTGASTGTAKFLPPLALDGTADPIKLLSLKQCSLGTETGSDEVLTYDSSNLGYSQGVPTSKSWSFDVAGVSSYNDAGYKILRELERGTVANSLMGKIVRVGPTGSTEKVYGFGRFMSFSESNEAGSVCEWNCQFEGYGGYGLRYSTT